MGNVLKKYINECFGTNKSVRKTKDIEELKQNIFEVYRYRKKAKKHAEVKKWLFNKIDMDNMDIKNYDPNKMDERINEAVDEWMRIWSLTFEINQII